MPRFLTPEAVLVIHYDQINTFGGSHGLRDRGLLESALGQARQTCEYTGDIYEAAAQYCVSLAKNHPFVDGNKRTAADSMLTFMVLNGIEPTLTNEQLFEWTLRIAISKLDRPALAALLTEHSRRKR
jgi:death-on-curing protein